MGLESRGGGNKTSPGSRTLLSRDEVIELLLEVARKAHNALEDSEERGEGSLVPRENAMELQAALDALEGLPAQPGYASCGPNNAKYALRSFEAQAADAQREVAEVWDKKVTPRSENERQIKADLDILATVVRTGYPAPATHQWTDDIYRKTAERAAELHGRAVEIFVNGQKHDFKNSLAHYEQIVRLAGYDPARVLTVTYLGGRSGIMHQGCRPVAVEKGMRFDVGDTSNA